MFILLIFCVIINTEIKGFFMFKRQTARYENGMEKYVVVDDDYNIYEPTILFVDTLYTGYKLNTRISYIDKVIKFLNFLNEKGMCFNEVTPSIITKYINYLQGHEVEGVVYLEQRLLGSSINTNLTAIAKFYDTLAQRELLDEGSPFEYVDGFNPSILYREFLYHAKMNKGKTKRRRLKVKENDNGFNRERRKTQKELESFKKFLPSKRDILIFDILYETGMRISDLLNLTINDYSEPGGDGFGFIEIVERDDTEYPNLKMASDRQVKTCPRQIDVYNGLIKRIDEYITEYRPYKPGIPGEDFIFVSNKRDATPIRRQAVEKVFHDTSEMSGIKITPHDLRHTHITELTEAGYDDTYIRLRIGHRSITALKRYQHPSQKSQREAYMRFYKKKEEIHERK